MKYNEFEIWNKNEIIINEDLKQDQNIYKTSYK